MNIVARITAAPSGKKGGRKPRNAAADAASAPAAASKGRQSASAASSAPARRRLSPYRRLLLFIHRLLPDRRAIAPERVSTAADIALEGLTISGPNRALGNGHQASPRAVVRWALDLLPEPAEDFVFVDLGCGRGRVVLEAARRPFRRIVGVEFAEELYDDAAMNLRHWPRSVMACRDVDIVHDDAATVDLPETDLVVYMFDPFIERMTTRVAARLAEHARRHRVYVILVEPRNAVIFRESPAFQPVEIARKARRRLRLLSPYDVRLFVAGRDAAAELAE